MLLSLAHCKLMKGRSRNASLAGLAVISFLLSGVDQSQTLADWPAIAGRSKPKQSVSNSSAKPDSKAAQTINGVLDEARVAERNGDLDRALLIAGRARRLADIATRGKPENVLLFHNATAYLNTLQAKQNEQIAVRSRSTPTTKPVVQQPTVARIPTPIETPTDFVPPRPSEGLSVVQQEPSVVNQSNPIVDPEVQSIQNEDPSPAPLRIESEKIAVAQDLWLGPVIRSRSSSLHPSEREPARVPLSSTFNSSEIKRNSEIELLANEEKPTAAPVVTNSVITKVVDANKVRPTESKTKIPLRRAKPLLTVDMIMSAQDGFIPPSPTGTPEEPPKNTISPATIEPQTLAVEETKIEADKPKLKLRKRFTARDLEDEPARTEIVETPVSNEDRPGMVRLDNLTESDVFETPSDAIDNETLTLNLDAESQSPSVAADESVPPTNVVIAQEDEKDPFEEDVPVPVVAESGSFPADEVRDLKRRLDSIAELQPGAMESDEFELATNDLAESIAANEATAETEEHIVETPAESEAVVLQKDVDFTEVSETEVNQTLPPLFARQPIVGTTSLIRWRAIENDTILGARLRPASRSVPSDLRESLRSDDSSVESSTVSHRSLFALPSVHFGRNAGELESSTPETDSKPIIGETRVQLRGNLWDNATTPTLDGYSGSISGSAKSVNSDDWALAPPTPDANVEQTSFDHQQPTSSASSDWEDDNSVPSIGTITIPPTTKHVSMYEAEFVPQVESTGHSLDKAESLDAQAEETQSEDTVEIPQLSFRDKLELLIGFLGLSSSTLSGAVCGALIVAGIWVIRAMTRANQA